jgi:hypothetical protein
VTDVNALFVGIGVLLGLLILWLGYRLGYRAGLAAPLPARLAAAREAQKRVDAARGVLPVRVRSSVLSGRKTSTNEDE